ncbi:pyridoxal 5'-phosphate synthase [Paraburkholderia phenazinium]|uniref:Pyridoxamine 5'-phosphate oxidase n=1 Tax=Paraburkholderia phenazinium TaxID=60549 RepID=A0A1G7YYW1_9BURK|nr:pyridoxal 5'-phosphate synthase [Paraburkholderia phenazinium]SDH01643.1 Pyridoxamine 5'-phosphate oxidase [Paraburkholderia phenazinium]
MDRYDDTLDDQLDTSIFNDAPDDPIALLQVWLDRARKLQVREPGALALATTGPDAHASNRIVQVLDIRGDALVFATHAQSQKGREIAALGWASGVLYWRETQQQVILSGSIAPISDEESDVLWARRSSDTHPMSSVSRQSETLEDEEALRLEAQRLASLGTPLPRPANWIGYALRPSVIEFWQAARDRLHGRLRYDATPSGWSTRRLHP